MLSPSAALLNFYCFGIETSICKYLLECNLMCSEIRNAIKVSATWGSMENSVLYWDRPMDETN